MVDKQDAAGDRRDGYLEDEEEAAIHEAPPFQDREQAVAYPYLPASRAEADPIHHCRHPLGLRSDSEATHLSTKERAFRQDQEAQADVSRL